MVINGMVIKNYENVYIPVIILLLTIPLSSMAAGSDFYPNSNIPKKMAITHKNQNIKMGKTKSNNWPPK